MTKGQQAAKAMMMMMYKLINNFVNLQPHQGTLQPNLRPWRPRKLMVPLTWTDISHIFWHLFLPSVNHTWNATPSITVAPPSPTKHSSAVLRAGRASTPIKSSTRVNFLIKLLGLLPHEGNHMMAEPNTEKLSAVQVQSTASAFHFYQTLTKTHTFTVSLLH